MKQFALIFLIVLLHSSVVLAAYQNPTKKKSTTLASGFIEAVYEFTGNDGEPTRERKYVVRPTSTETHLRNWVDDTKKDLDRLHANSTIPGLRDGQTVTGLARVTPPLPAQQVRAEKYERLRKYENSGLTNAAFVNDLAALRTDVNNSYQAGFLNQ